MTDASTETEALLAVLRTAGTQIIATKSAFIAVYALVLYDHALTLSDEIKYIWRRRWSVVTLLFFITRYYALAAFTLVLVSFFSPLFNPKVSVRSLPRFIRVYLTPALRDASQSSCSHFAGFFPFGLGIPLTIVPGIIMGLRVVALYKNSKLTQLIVGGYLLAELCTGLWVYSVPGGHPLALPTMVHGDAFTLCTDLAADSLGNIKSATFQFMETIYDTVIFVLVVVKTAQAARISSLRESITFLITTQSLIYFAIIFSSNLLWALMIILAPTGLKYATAIPTIMLVCTMVNRLTLDLRAFFHHENATTMHGSEPLSVSNSSQRNPNRLSLKLASPSRTALSTTFSGMDEMVSGTREHDAKRGGMHVISEGSNELSGDMEEYEMHGIKKGGSYASPV